VEHIISLIAGAIVTAVAKAFREDAFKSGIERLALWKIL
jgi:hypothetical protein